MVIIGLLAGYVGPKYFAQIGKSEIKATKAQIDALEKALDQYRLDVGHYPNTEQGLASLMKRPAGESRWQGPYLKKDVPLDPSKINPLGGAIALGHPLGATGAIRTATLVHGLQRTGGKYGMVSMCIGTGMGAAGIFERL